MNDFDTKVLQAAIDANRQARAKMWDELPDEWCDRWMKSVDDEQDMEQRMTRASAQLLAQQGALNQASQQIQEAPFLGDQFGGVAIPSMEEMRGRVNSMGTST